MECDQYSAAKFRGDIELDALALPAPWFREMVKPASVSPVLKVILGAIKRLLQCGRANLKFLSHVDRYEQCTWHLDFHDHFTARPDAD